MTQNETILVAIEDVGEAEAAAADVVLKAWAIDFKRFSLKPDGLHPDSHKVLCALAYLVRLDQVFRPSPNKYALTAKGREIVRHVKAMAATKDESRMARAVDLAGKLAAMRAKSHA